MIASLDLVAAFDCHFVLALVRGPPAVGPASPAHRSSSPASASAVTGGGAPSGAALVAAQQPSQYGLLRQVRLRPGDYALQPSPLRHFLRVPSTTSFDHVDKVVGNVAVGSVGEMNQIAASPDRDTAGAVEAGQFLAVVLGHECREWVENSAPWEGSE